jgi:hypothetical protein
MAKEISERLQKEKCREIKNSSICQFCHSRYGFIQAPYLPDNTVICYQCYIMNNKDALINMCCNDINNFNSHLVLPRQYKQKETNKHYKSILKKNKNTLEEVEKMIETIENESEHQIHFTDTKKVHFNIIQSSYNTYHSYFIQ